MSGIDSESDREFYGSNDSDEEIEVVAVASIFEPYLNEPLIPDDEGIRGENQIVADESKDVDGLALMQMCTSSMSAIMKMTKHGAINTHTLHV